MQKYGNADIKPFEFSDLKGTHVVSGEKGFKPFSFEELNGESVSNKVSDEEVRRERTFEKNNNFKIDSAVRDSRGLARQEQNDFERAIQSEVEKRLQTAYQQAYAEGLEKGREEGKAEAFTHYQQEMQQKVEDFANVLVEVQGQSNTVMEKNRHEIYEFIKRFTKWIVLKEINEKVYLEQLLEKLILELNARKNLIVKVGKNNFKDMPEVIKAVEARIGTLSNIRVEIVPEINHPGIILEAENGLINGSLEGVFQSIDRVFEQVLGHES
jgi:flagellar assembly protein FliH